MSKESKVAYADKTLGKNVKQEAPQEFDSTQSHLVKTMIVTIVPPRKSDLAVLESQKTVIGNSDAMSVAGEVFENLLGTSKGRLGVDDPVFLVKLGKPAFEDSRRAQPSQRPAQSELTVLIGLCETLEEFSSKDRRQDLDGEKKPSRTRDPLTLIRGQSPPWNDAVNMRMKVERLTPRVKDREKTDLAAEMMGVASNLLERLGGTAHQKVVDKDFVL
jgi:hypothetical protein